MFFAIYVAACFSFSLLNRLCRMQVFLCQKLTLINEMYFAIALDRASAGPVSASSQTNSISALFSYS